MSMSMEQIMEFARQQWGEGPEPSPGNVHAAAVGLVSNWYRNTNAVETVAHAEGPWTDEDMLRKNAWATDLARLAIIQVADCADDLETVEDVLEGLLDGLVTMLPTEGAKRELRSEKQGAPALATDWIAANGFGNWLAFLTNGLQYPSAWWGALGYPEVVDQYCALDPGPPEPESFRERMLSGPWQLSDEQAEFVCRHRYDVR
jgi:hypothetical protein